MKDFSGLGFGVGINCVAPKEKKDVRKIFVIHLTLQTSSYPGSCPPLERIVSFLFHRPLWHQPSVVPLIPPSRLTLLHFLLLCPCHAIKAPALTHPAWYRVGTQYMIDEEREGEIKEEKKEKRKHYD